MCAAYTRTYILSQSVIYSLLKRKNRRAKQSLYIADCERCNQMQLNEETTEKLYIREDCADPHRANARKVQMGGRAGTRPRFATRLIFSICTYIRVAAFHQWQRGSNHERTSHLLFPTAGIVPGPEDSYYVILDVLE